MVAMDEDSVRFCAYCNSFKVIEEFRRRSASSSTRMNECRECHNKAERERKAWKQQKLSKRLMAKRLGELSRTRSWNEVEMVIKIMLREFGGMVGFKHAFAKHYAWAYQNGRYPLIRCLQACLRVTSHYEDMQIKEQRLAEAQPGYSSIQYWTDEELECSYQKSLVETIEQKPELAIEAARKLGWTVIPPEVQLPEE
jgi:hypothetical protein